MPFPALAELRRPRGSMPGRLQRAVNDLHTQSNINTDLDHSQGEEEGTQCGPDQGTQKGSEGWERARMRKSFTERV